MTLAHHLRSLARVLLFSLGVGLAVPGMAQTCEMSVRWRQDPPYSLREADGRLGGINVEINRVILERLGCRARFVEMPWARALIELEEGRLDILPGALRNPERERFAHFSRPTNRSPNILFVSKGAKQKYTLRKLADILGTDFRLGAQIKVSYGPDYDALLPEREFGQRLTFLTDRIGAWRMIASDRIDGLIADEITAMIEIRDLGLSETIVASDVIVSDEPARTAFSRRSVDATFVERYNQAFEAALKDGTYRAIAQRYLPCKVAPGRLGCL